ncbi:MAG: Opr family porin [Campylobacteraceae bacterium]|nr:Opr family porin [Campylobacteraceae bacterium]
MKKISLVAASLLLTSNLVANSIDEAFKAGTVSGDITLYGERQDNSGGNKDSGFTMGSIGLTYETGELNGFKAAVGFRGNHDFSEVEKDDYSDGSEKEAIVHTANIAYANEYLGLTLGRQEIDLEWLGDYNEAAVLGITAIPNTTVVLGYTNRIAVADADAPLEDFDDFGENGDGQEIDYAAVLDAKYEGVKGLVVNPYVYDADNLANWYGLKVDYDTDMFGVTVHGASSNEDVSGTEDGDIAHIEGRLNIAGFGFNLGYITTDNDGGVGSMATLGDNINPFDALRGGDGEKVYEADAQTTYLNVNYEISGVELGAMYGEMEYGSDKDKEFDFTVDYGITDNLSIGALYVNLDAENSDDDYDKLTLTVEYSF